MAGRATNRVRVKIGGIEYTLRGDASEAQMREVAATVDRMLNQIQKANPQLDQRRAAVLCAVNLADEYQRLAARYDELEQLLDEQTRTPERR